MSGALVEQRRPLGSTGADISPVGFGAWAAGGPWTHGWGAQDDRDSIAAIHRAVELGVNWIDTASVYGLGHSEIVVGMAVAALSPEDRPLVFTKCAYVWDSEDRVGDTIRDDHTPASIRRQLEDSLRRLGLEQVDLYQVHWPPESSGAQLEEYWEAMLDLRRQGKARAIGLSNHDVGQLEAAEVVGHVDTLQPPLSMINRSAAAEIAWCADHGTGVIVYSPMQGGLLSGAFSEDRIACLPADDWRREDPEFSTHLSRNLKLAGVLSPIAERYGVSVAAVAVAWTIAWPGVSGAIVGARTPEQVDGWIAAASVELGGEDLDEIASAIERTGAGTGPAQPD